MLHDAQVYRHIHDIPLHHTMAVDDVKKNVSRIGRDNIFIVLISPAILNDDRGKMSG